MLVDVIDPYHFLSMLQTKKLVDVKIFDLNTPTHFYQFIVMWLWFMWSGLLTRVYFIEPLDIYHFIHVIKIMRPAIDDINQFTLFLKTF